MMMMVTTFCTIIFQGDDMLHEIYYNIGVVEVRRCFSYGIKFLLKTLNIKIFFCI